MTEVPPRIRLAESVDLSKAKNHARCNGTGIVGYRYLPNPENKDEMIRVPVVCRCVARSGGVRRDEFDRIADDVQQQLDDGTFGENLARDVARLPYQVRKRKIFELKQTVAKDGDPTVAFHISKAIEILEQEEKNVVSGE